MDAYEICEQHSASTDWLMLYPNSVSQGCTKVRDFVHHRYKYIDIGCLQKKYYLFLSFDSACLHFTVITRCILCLYHVF